MRSICRGIQAGGEGTVRVSRAKPKGLRNKRKRTWANERKVKDMLAKARQDQIVSDDFENFEDND